MSIQGFSGLISLLVSISRYLLIFLMLIYTIQSYTVFRRIQHVANVLF